MQSKIPVMSEDFSKLKDQICYRLYLASNGITRLYKPLLAPLGLTYPQYILMLSLWEKDHVPMGQLATQTSMDKGFLTTLVKNLQEKALIQISADSDDSRKKIIDLTKKGQKLREKAKDIPKTLFCLIGGDKSNPSEVTLLKAMLDELNQAISRIE